MKNQSLFVHAIFSTLTGMIGDKFLWVFIEILGQYQRKVVAQLVTIIVLKLLW